MYRLLALDIDGTLLDSNHKLSERNIRAVKNAALAGTEVVLCSGRSRFDITAIADKLEVCRYIVAFNGAEVWDIKQNRLLHSQLISANKAELLLDWLASNQMVYDYYASGNLYIPKKQLRSNYYWINGLLDRPLFSNLYSVLEDMQKGAERGVTKFEVCPDNPQDIYDLRSSVSFIGGLSTVASGYNSVDIVHESVSKAEGLFHIMQLLQIEKESLAAIGDQENDVSMFQIAGMAIAMGNATATVRLQAHRVTSCCDKDGVAHAINNILQL